MKRDLILKEKRQREMKQNNVMKWKGMKACLFHFILLFSFFVPQPMIDDFLEMEVGEWCEKEK